MSKEDGWTGNFTDLRKFYKHQLIFVSQKTIGVLISLIEQNLQASVQTFLHIILIGRRDDFVYSKKGCTSIYPPLSNPLRSLIEQDTRVKYNMKQSKH